MAQTLVLVRHGKAEKPGSGTADIDRSLTKAGLEALGRTFPLTFSLLAGTKDTGAPFQIWVSPAKRARQTAEAAASALAANGTPAKAPEEHPCLWEQDGTAFLDELAAAPADARVIAVGHIPFMQDMLQRLTHADVSFAPGGAAAIELEGSPTDVAPGRLLWFVQGPRTK